MWGLHRLDLTRGENMSELENSAFLIYQANVWPKQKLNILFQSTRLGLEARRHALRIKIGGSMQGVIFAKFGAIRLHHRLFLPPTKPGPADNIRRQSYRAVYDEAHGLLLLLLHGMIQSLPIGDRGFAVPSSYLEAICQSLLCAHHNTNFVTLFV